MREEVTINEYHEGVLDGDGTVLYLVYGYGDMNLYMC